MLTRVRQSRQRRANPRRRVERLGALEVGVLDRCPSSLDIPKLEISFIETPSPHTALGIKGMGESGTVFAPAAIATAVGDAPGVEINHLGLAPSEVIEFMQSGRNARGD